MTHHYDDNGQCHLLKMWPDTIMLWSFLKLILQQTSKYVIYRNNAKIKYSKLQIRVSIAFKVIIIYSVCLSITILFKINLKNQFGPSWSPRNYFKGISWIVLTQTWISNSSLEFCIVSLRQYSFVWSF